MTIKQKLVQKADSSFVDDWRNAHKWLSVQFSLVIGVVIAYATANPEQVLNFVGSLPEQYRVPLGFVLTTIIPIYLRLKSQGEK